MTLLPLKWKLSRGKQRWQLLLRWVPSTRKGRRGVARISGVVGYWPPILPSLPWCTNPPSGPHYITHGMGLSCYTNEGGRRSLEEATIRLHNTQHIKLLKTRKTGKRHTTRHKQHNIAHNIVYITSQFKTHTKLYKHKRRL